MAEIVPFQAYRYNLDRVRLGDVVTQPYDKITPTMQTRYAETSPNNLIFVEKGKASPADSATDNVYTRAEAKLEEWIRSGILVRDSLPGIYVYFQEYTPPGGGERRMRKGFIALGRVEDYSANVVFRHEQTLAGPKVDRLELLRNTKTHTGQLFMLYSDPKREIDALLDKVANASSPAEARDEYGVAHRVWPVFDRDTIAAIVRHMADQKLVIADGHHRYETALAYRNESRAKSGSHDIDAPYEKAMMTFFNTRSEGLLILPTHRVIGNLPNFDADDFRRKMAAAFNQDDYSYGSDAARSVAYERFRRDLAEHGKKGHAIGMYTPGGFTLFRLKPNADLNALLPDVPAAQRQLDLTLLHKLMIEKGLGITAAAVTNEKNITYEREMDSAIAAVDQDGAQLCFLLNAVDVETVAQIALSGEVMPQKSTDFFPKLMSGLTLYRLE